jgi:hypothetical protein
MMIIHIKTQIAIHMLNIIYNVFLLIFITLSVVFLGYGVSSIDYLLIGIGALFGLASLLIAFDHR